MSVSGGIVGWVLCFRVSQGDGGALVSSEAGPGGLCLSACGCGQNSAPFNLLALGTQFLAGRGSETTFLDSCWLEICLCSLWCGPPQRDHLLHQSQQGRESTRRALQTQITQSWEWHPVTSAVFCWLEASHRSYSCSKGGCCTVVWIPGGGGTGSTFKSVYHKESHMLVFLKVQKAVKCKVKFSFLPLILTMST